MADDGGDNDQKWQGLDAVDKFTSKQRRAIETVTNSVSCAGASEPTETDWDEAQQWDPLLIREGLVLDFLEDRQYKPEDHDKWAQGEGGAVLDRPQLKLSCTEDFYRTNTWYKVQCELSMPDGSPTLSWQAPRIFVQLEKLNDNIFYDLEDAYKTRFSSTPIPSGLFGYFSTIPKLNAWLESLASACNSQRDMKPDTLANVLWFFAAPNAKTAYVSPVLPAARTVGTASAPVAAAAVKTAAVETAAAAPAQTAAETAIAAPAAQEPEASAAAAAAPEKDAV